MNFSIFRIEKHTSIKYFRILAVFAIIALASTIFCYPIRNHMPSGADSSVYVNDARWILDNNRLPEPNQVITHNYQAYPSPGTDIIVTLIVLLTGLPILTAFAWYQLFLIILLFFTTYLVGSLYSKRLALFFIIALIGSFSLFRLYIGSTVSNIMAFSIINLIFYFSIILSRAANKLKYIILLAVLFVSLYLFHSYLTAPIFIGVFVAYVILLLLTQKGFRTQVKIFLNERSLLVLIAIGLIIISTIIVAVTKYRSIGLQAMQAFTSPINGDKFQYIVEWKQLGKLLGQPIWDLALLGIVLFLSKWKENMHSWRIFPLLWIVVLWALAQSYYLGIHFYFERLVFLAGVAVAYFVAVTMDNAINAKGRASLLTFLLVSMMTISGVGYMVTLFQVSNKVGNDQLAALQVLAQRIKPLDIVLSNNNGVAQTRHDMIITDANIRYYPSVNRSCKVDDRVCNSFTLPDSNKSADVLRESSVSYILLLKPNYESNTDLDALARKYSINKNFQTVFESNEAYVFQLEK